MLPDLRTLSLTPRVCKEITAVGAIEVVDADSVVDKSVRDVIADFAFLNDLSWDESYYQLRETGYIQPKQWSLVSFVDATSDLNTIGAPKRPRDDTLPTLTVSLFGNGPCTPSTEEQVDELMQLALAIYQAKRSLNETRRSIHRADVEKERNVFISALDLCKQAVVVRIPLEKWQLYSDLGKSRVEEYLKYMQNLAARLDRRLKERGMVIDTPWKTHLFATRKLKTTAFRRPEQYVLDAIRTLFYYVEIGVREKDKLELKPDTEYPISMYGMNARTWHELHVNKVVWAWLVILPIRPRTDLGYVDDLTDLERVIIHLQRGNTRDLTWRPGKDELAAKPRIMFFQGNTFIGYYSYVGFEAETDDDNRPPRAILQRISAITHQDIKGVGS